MSGPCPNESRPTWQEIDIIARKYAEAARQEYELRMKDLEYSLKLAWEKAAKWEEEAGRYAENASFWRNKCEGLEDEVNQLKRTVRVLENNPIHIAVPVGREQIKKLEYDLDEARQLLRLQEVEIRTLRQVIETVMCRNDKVAPEAGP